METHVVRAGADIDLPWQVSVWRGQKRVDILPERAGSANVRELFRNGATAKKSLPKSIRNKNIAKVMV
jgi:hypothetical protein